MKKFNPSKQPPIGREEEAAIMLGNTKFRRGASQFLNLAFGASVFGVALSYGLAREAEPGAVLQQARPQTQLALSKYLQGSNAQVAVGPDNWLFYQQGVQHLVGTGFLNPMRLKARRVPEKFPDPRTTILNFRAQLRERGIELVLMPIPDKAAIYPEQLWLAYKSKRTVPRNASFEKFVREMSDKEVLIYDPTALMLDAKRTAGKPLYVGTDTHWTPEGVKVCAQGLSAWVKSCTSLPEVRRVPYITKTGTTSSPRDLVNLLGLPESQDMFEFPRLELREVHEANGKYVRPDPKADVLLLGDSYCGSYTGSGSGLAAQLAYELGRPVDVVSVPNGGSWGARFKLRKLMDKGEDRLAGKKLVIWEFAERDLSFGNWMPCEFPKLVEEETGEKETGRER